jgi:hypothetical protein
LTGLGWRRPLFARAGGEVVADSPTRADAALNRFRRKEPDGRAVLLHLTVAGLYAAQGAPGAAQGAAEAQHTENAPAAAGGVASAPTGATAAEVAASARDGATGVDVAPAAAPSATAPSRRS